MHRDALACSALARTGVAVGERAGRTWQTSGVNVIDELLRTFGWNFRVRRMAWALRIKQYATLAAVVGSIGTAIGYAIATRGVVDEDADPDRVG